MAAVKNLLLGDDKQVALYKKKMEWAQVARVVGTRDARQCSMKWYNNGRALVFGEKLDQWTPADSVILVKRY